MLGGQPLYGHGVLQTNPLGSGSGDSWFEHGNSKRDAAIRGVALRLLPPYSLCAYGERASVGSSQRAGLDDKRASWRRVVLRVELRL